MKAQSWSVDFSLGLLIFLLAGILSFKLLANTTQPNTFQEVYDEAKYLSESFMDEGYPINWTNDTVVKIGLLKENKFQVSKYLNLSVMSYGKTKQHLNTVAEYYIYFENEYGQALNISGLCGYGHSDVTLLPAENKAAYYFFDASEGFMAYPMEGYAATMYAKSGESIAGITTIGDFDALLDSLQNYHLVFLENPHLSESVSLHTEAEAVTLLENWVAQGNTLFITQQAGINESFNVNFSSGLPSGVNPVNITNNVYFNFTLGEALYFAQLDTVQNINADDYVLIGNYSDGKSAMARWEYGNGEVFYLSDLVLTAPFNGNMNITSWISESLGPRISTTCGAVNVSSLHYKNLVSITRIMPYDARLIRMVILAWRQT
ncbi:hypothetical protein C4573_02060 [Candidatus Woesearchaeota archaeon]|nr:MAG: hypothetical protein C4573_02060 [Candidatus Woesearchaeota archaeon]